jgi:uncharacterized protein (DUF488 family)
MGVQAAPRLVSVGYEGLDMRTLIEQLKKRQVRWLVDVRLNPISRKPGLSKLRSQEALAAVDITYVHHRELGNPKDNRQGLRAGVAASRARFQDLLQSEGASEALRHVDELLDDGTVAVLCFERSHESCHRGIVTEAIAKRRPGLNPLGLRELGIPHAEYREAVPVLMLIADEEVDVVRVGHH